MDVLPLFDPGDDFSNVKTVPVNLKENSYKIVIGQKLLSKVNILWKKFDLSSQVLIVSNQEIFDLYGKQIKQSFDQIDVTPIIHIVPQGESAKNYQELNKIYDILVENKFARDSVIVAFGGGVIGDLTGYAAATYMRGVNFIQIPTTLLAQVDSSVGGKTAINHAKGKNLIGAFYQPKAVLIDTDVLATLPAREVRTGLAEVVKYGVIDDADFFDYLEKHCKELGEYNSSNAKIWEHIVVASCKSKAKVVSIDEKESGLRAILNYGHTAGHAFEALTNYITYNHGEAVAIGMVVAALISKNRGLVGADMVGRITSLLVALGLPTTYGDLDINDILDRIKLDKKVKAGRIRFVIPKKMGHVDVVSDITAEEMTRALEEAK